MEDFLFWLLALGIPGAMWTVNISMRKLDAIRTAGADWMLLLITFDFTGVASSGDFAKFVVSADFKHVAGSLFLICALLILVMWIGTIQVLEPYVNKRKDEGASLRVQLGWYGLGWCFALAGTAANMFIFYHK